jgi:hypothetical protein
MGTENEQDLTSHHARRRRALIGVLAGAAIAVPGVAFAATSGSPSSSSSTTQAPASTIQDEGGTDAQDRDGDGRDCPEERGGSGGGADDGGAASPQAL